MEPEIHVCTKMLGNVKNVEQNFLRLHLATPVKSGRVNDAFSEIFELGASPAEGQSLPQKKR